MKPSIYVSNIPGFEPTTLQSFDVWTKTLPLYHGATMSFFFVFILLILKVHKFSIKFPMTRFKLTSMDQSITQPMDQSITRAIRHCRPRTQYHSCSCWRQFVINVKLNQSIILSMDRSITLSIDQSITLAIQHCRPRTL